MGGSAKFSSVVGNVKSLVTEINNMMLTSIQRSSTLVNNIKNGMGQLNQGIQVGYGPQSANLLFNQPPVPTAAATASQLPGVAGYGGAIGNNLYQHRYSYGMAAAGAFLSTMPSPNDQVNLNYLTNRSLFYGLGGYDTKSFGGSSNTPGFLPFAKNTREEQYNRVSGVQREFSKMGTTTSAMDAVKAMMAGQSNGIAMALPGYQNILKGVADMSNLTPGVGLEGSMGAYAALQQAPRVNMLRLAGISVRDPITGQPKSFREIAEQIWNKLQREKIGSQPITKEDIAQGLLPGNSLDQMMKNLFGGDQFLASQVTAALYAKASGAKNFSKAELERVGGTTYALNTQSGRTTKQLETLQQTSRAGAGGFAASNDIATVLGSLSNVLDRLTGVLSAGSYTNAFGLGIGGMGNGIVTKGFGAIFGLLKAVGVPGFASGGDMAGDGKTPYIVGEKGPELFVPKVDGTIIPNHELPPGIHRKKGGGVQSGGADASQLLFDYLTSQGLSKGGAEGVIGNLTHESGLNPTITGDKGTSYGIAQWHNNRWDNLKKFAKDRNLDPGTLDAQKQFLMHELQGKQYKSLLKQLKDPSTSKYDAAAAFMRTFERPKDQSDAAALKRANAYGTKVDLPPGGGSSSSNSDSSDTSLKSLLMSTAGGSNLMSKESSSTTNNNYGGVTIVISGAKDKKEVAAEVSKLFSNNGANLITKIGNN